MFTLTMAGSCHHLSVMNAELYLDPSGFQNNLGNQLLFAITAELIINWYTTPCPSMVMPMASNMQRVSD